MYYRVWITGGVLLVWDLNHEDQQQSKRYPLDGGQSLYVTATNNKTLAAGLIWAVPTFIYKTLNQVVV